MHIAISRFDPVCLSQLSVSVHRVVTDRLVAVREIEKGRRALLMIWSFQNLVTIHVLYHNLTENISKVLEI